jgi:hypothetical protein
MLCQDKSGNLGGQQHLKYVTIHLQTRVLVDTDISGDELRSL